MVLFFFRHPFQSVIPRQPPTATTPSLKVKEKQLLLFMLPTEEPYHYLQKKVGAIIEELTNELNDNVAEFKRLSKETYDVEEKIHLSRGSYVRVNREIEAEIKKQQEVERVLEYFDSEIEKIREAIHSQKTEGSEAIHYGAVGDIDGLINEFNSLVCTLDIGVPNSINILLNENMNLINYAEALIHKASSKRALSQKSH
ncbi:hypothetical protein NEDG_01914 [Nematocida displodere]|uniref:Nucleoporin NSP1-like C-terminal domain-containing protein n=1 Tax=Nematocida displodere TaxID=1805483 RepID=A0A177EIC4_9MICR|nr:hypothetical protein NEDG_01914 [Nematocida displodere]